MAVNEEQAQAPNVENVQEETEDSDEPDEYSVEAIRGKRKNQRTGLTEYLIKWQDYPESDNTWEPIDNLKCPDLILKFNEAEKNKRKRRSVVENKESQTKRTRKLDDSRTNAEPIFVEDEVDNISTTETLSSTDSNQKEKQKELAEIAARQPKGFDRGLPIDKIIGSCTDDDRKLWFFVKWQGMPEMELVDVTEVEEKAPRVLCCWYRERLLYNIDQNTKNQTDLTVQ